MNSGPIWQTPAGFLFSISENLPVSTPLVASGTNVSYSIISGSLPSGFQLSSTGTLYGKGLAVLNIAESTFVVRAKSNEGISDRTFIVYITGKTTPIWSTTNVTVIGTSTYLNLGPKGESWALNNQYVNFRLNAWTNPILTPEDASFSYFIGDDSRQLPNGLNLSNDGIISGFVSDSLSIDPTLYRTVPKLYRFTVTVTDGIVNSNKEFSILVVDPSIVQDPGPFLGNLSPGVITSNTNYVPPLQFIEGSNLGTYIAENRAYISVAAYDPYPTTPVVSYSLNTGSSIYLNPPANLELDKDTGILYGYIPYQPSYTQTYTFEVNATRSIITPFPSTTSVYTTTNYSVTATNTFTLAIKGAIDSSIEWVSGSDIGSIDLGTVSELYVAAQQVNNDYNINYRQTSGSLPLGLELKPDGSISGSVDYTASTGTYSIGVEASDVYNFSKISKDFYLTVTKYNNKKYTEIYCRPFLSREMREKYNNFITDNFTFDPKLIYRYADPNFGIQAQIKLKLEFGIEQSKLTSMAGILQENFYRRRVNFGDVKVAIAKDDAGTTVYEVVYIDVVDNLVNNNGVSVNRVVALSTTTSFYPASIDNMRIRFSQLVLEDHSTVDINEYMLPRFMRTAQPGYYQSTEYIAVIPLCYALPGQGSKIASRIKLSGFDFKLIDFEIDRIIVEDSLDNTTAKYLILERQPLGE